LCYGPIYFRQRRHNQSIKGSLIKRPPGKCVVDLHRWRVVANQKAGSLGHRIGHIVIAACRKCCNLFNQRFGPCHSADVPVGRLPIVDCRMTTPITRSVATGGRRTSRNVMLEVLLVDITLAHVLLPKASPSGRFNRRYGHQCQIDSAILTPNGRTKSSQSGAGLLRPHRVQLDRFVKISFRRPVVSRF